MYFSCFYRFQSVGLEEGLKHVLAHKREAGVRNLPRIQVTKSECTKEGLFIQHRLGIEQKVLLIYLHVVSGVHMKKI
jgi:hypothetical protein